MTTAITLLTLIRRFMTLSSETFTCTCPTTIISAINYPISSVYLKPTSSAILDIIFILGAFIVFNCIKVIFLALDYLIWVVMNIIAPFFKAVIEL